MSRRGRQASPPSSPGSCTHARMDVVGLFPLSVRLVRMEAYMEFWHVVSYLLVAASFAAGMAVMFLGLPANKR